MISNYKIALLLLSLTFIFSCKQKDNLSTLGLDVQPENDLLGITINDTASVFMHTQKVDSIRTYNDGTKYLGSVQDPIFGRTDASIYTNFSISNNLTNVSFVINGKQPILDSAEMVIVYTDNTYIGDATSSLTYKVHLLNSTINNTVAYYNSQKFDYATTTVNTSNGVLATRSGSTCLVFKLDYNMAKYILETETNLTNNTAFQNANKGFYITTESSSLVTGIGAIRKFNLDNVISGVNLHYNYGGLQPKGEVFQFSFRGTDAARTNYIKHNYATVTPTFASQINNTDTTKGNTAVYLNNFGGTRARIYLPYLKNFSDSQVVSISRAELILKVDPSNVNNLNFSLPSELALIVSSFIFCKV